MMDASCRVLADYLSAELIYGLQIGNDSCGDVDGDDFPNADGVVYGLEDGERTRQAERCCAMDGWIGYMNLFSITALTIR